MWGGEGWREGSGGELEVCEGGGSAAGEGGRREGASEGGGEEGSAGVCIAACKFLASWRPVAEESAFPQTSWSPNCESTTPGVCVSVCLPLCVSMCPCVSVHPQQRKPAMFERPAVSACLRGRPALGGASLCPWVDPTGRRRRGAGKMMKRWEEGGWRDESPLQPWDKLGMKRRLTGRKMWRERR